MNSSKATSEVHSMPAARAAIDLTPFAVNHWASGGAAVVSVSPEATTHQKVALSWGMASEIESISEAACAGSTGGGLAKDLCVILHERAVLLQVLLYDLAQQTAEQEEKAAAA